MKYGMPLCMALAVALLMTGCGNDAANEPEPKDEPVAVEPSEQEDSDDELDIDDEGAPEYLVSESLEDATEIELHSELTVDGVDTVYRCAALKVPSTLTVDEVLTIEGGSSPYSNDDGLDVDEYFDGFEERVSMLETDGVIPATRQATDHKLSATCYYDSEPLTLEELRSEYTRATVKEVVVDGASGFIVLPNPETTDTAFVDAILYVTVGSAETPYGAKPFVVQVAYAGGMMNIADVDLAMLETAMIDMVDVDFGVDE